VFDKFFAEFGMFVSALFAIPAFSFFIEFAHLVCWDLSIFVLTTLCPLAACGLAVLALAVLALAVLALAVLALAVLALAVLALAVLALADLVVRIMADDFLRILKNCIWVILFILLAFWYDGSKQAL
jgi:hypothetical protein